MHRTLAAPVPRLARRLATSLVLLAATSTAAAPSAASRQIRLPNWVDIETVIRPPSTRVTVPAATSDRNRSANQDDRKRIITALRRAKRIATAGPAVLITGGVAGTVMVILGFRGTIACGISGMFNPEQSCDLAVGMTIAGGILAGLAVLVGLPMWVIGSDMAADLQRELSLPRSLPRVGIRTIPRGGTSFFLGWQF